jgi:hypothetical protein
VIEGTGAFNIAYGRWLLLELVDHVLFKMVKYVLLRPLRPELDALDVEANDLKIWVFGSHFI